MRKIFICTLCVAVTAGCTEKSLAQPAAWNHVWVEQLHKPQDAFFDEKNAYPIEFYGSENDQIIIPVRVNGDDLWALVDTGAPSTTIDINWAESRKIPLENESTASAIDGAKYKQWVIPIQSIDIGGFHQKGGGLIAANVPTIINPYDGKKVSIILGMDFISNFSLSINFDDRRLSIKASGSCPPIGYAIPLKSDNLYTKAVLDISLFGQTFNGVVDTGRNTSLSVYKHSIKIPYNLQITDLAQSTAAGVIVEDYASVTGLKLFQFKIDNPTLVLLQNSRDGGGVEGAVGLELLDKYNIFMDIKRGIMVLSKRSSPAKPLHKTNMGIQGDITNNGWVVAHVMKNSPAAAVGLKDGDQICAVDGNKLVEGSDKRSGHRIAACDRSERAPTNHKRAKQAASVAERSRRPSNRGFG